MKISHSNSNFTKVPEGPTRQEVSIASYNGLAPDMRHAITWTNDDPILLKYICVIKPACASDCLQQKLPETWMWFSPISLSSYIHQIHTPFSTFCYLNYWKTIAFTSMFFCVFMWTGWPTRSPQISPNFECQPYVVMHIMSFTGARDTYMCHNSQSAMI